MNDHGPHGRHLTRPCPGMLTSVVAGRDRRHADPYGLTLDSLLLLTWGADPPTSGDPRPGAPRRSEPRQDSGAPDEWAEELHGRVLNGRYRIDAVLGYGMTGGVFRGTHLGLSKPVAIKILHEEMRSKPPVRIRFEREARMASRLSHRNCVEIIDVDEDQEVSYFVMPLLEGVELGQLMGVPVDLATASNIARQLLEALDHAHCQGIVHRDVKPENVLVVSREGEPDLVKLLDFGIAKVAYPTGHKRLTAAGQVFGTPQYMSPEQAMGIDVNARSDLYSTGLILYELLTGTPPFASDDVLTLVTMRLDTPVPPLRGIVPDAIANFVERLVARDQTERYASAAEALRALDHLEGREPTSGAFRPVSTGPHVPSPTPTLTASGTMLPVVLDPDLHTPPPAWPAPSRQTLPSGPQTALPLPTQAWAPRSNQSSRHATALTATVAGAVVLWTSLLMALLLSATALMGCSRPNPLYDPDDPDDPDAIGTTDDPADPMGSTAGDEADTANTPTEPRDSAPSTTTLDDPVDSTTTAPHLDETGASSTDAVADETGATADCTDPPQSLSQWSLTPEVVLDCAEAPRLQIDDYADGDPWAGASSDDLIVSPWCAGGSTCADAGFSPWGVDLVFSLPPEPTVRSARLAVEATTNAGEPANVLVFDLATGLPLGRCLLVPPFGAALMTRCEIDLDPCVLSDGMLTVALEIDLLAPNCAALLDRVTLTLTD
ncbi:MAG: serine/threonine-protein kinase [Myxococcota bacterium]